MRSCSVQAALKECCWSKGPALIAWTTYVILAVPKRPVPKGLLAGPGSLHEVSARHSERRSSANCPLKCLLDTQKG
eukprot:4854247-Heterocapsa_arctica.AAC.1